MKDKSEKISGTNGERGPLESAETYRFVLDMSTRFIDVTLNELAAVFQKVLADTTSFTNADRAFFLCLYENEDKVEAYYEYAGENFSERKLSLCIEQHEHSFRRLIKTLNNEKNVAVSNTNQLPVQYKAFGNFFVPSLAISSLFVGIRVGSNTNALIGLDRINIKTEWDKDTKALLEELGKVFVKVISRRRHLEAFAYERNLMTALMDNIPDAIYFKDQESRFTRISKAHANLFNLSTPEEAIGKTDSDFFSEEHAKAAFADEQEIIKTGKPIIDKVEKETWPDRPETWVTTTKMPLRDESGEIYGTFGISRDITERKKLGHVVKEHAHLLSEANEALRLRNRELDEFSHIASHDLQEPLRKISAFSDLLLEDLETDDKKAMAHDVEVLAGAARRMQRLVHDLLALSRSGRQAMHFDILDLNQVVEDALDSLSITIEEHNAEIVCDTLPQIRGDRTLLTQLFQNLIGNGIKFCDKDRPRIEISKEPEGECQIRVSDNGIGLKPEYAEQIFSPFQRLHGRDEYEGTGIGLAICRKIVERHGGRIWVESELGHGASFILTLDTGFEGDYE